MPGRSEIHTLPRRSAGAPLWMIVAAFAAIYLVWGSTYLAIRWAIVGLPPYFMAGSRFVIAGLVLGAWMVARGERLPARRQWANAFVVGTLLIACGNGTVTWAEVYVPSGLVALFCALVPMCMVGLQFLIPEPDASRARRPRAGAIVGLVVGIAGVVLLVRGQDGAFDGLGAGPMPKVAGLALAASTVLWSLGSLLTRRLDLPGSAFVSAAAQMLTGGIVLLGVSAVRGEFAEVSPSRLTGAVVLSHLYLIVFGSIVGMTAYTWLLGVVSPARVATYAYVNPILALLFGWLLGGETLGPMTGLAAAVIVAGVAMIISFGDRTTPASSRVRLPVGSSAGDAAPATPVRRESADHYAWGQDCSGWHLTRAHHVSVIEERMPPGAAEARHAHRVATQFFYVLQGRLTVEVGVQPFVIGAREGIEVPAGHPHEVRNEGAEAAEFLVISHPPSHGDRVSAG